MMGGGGPTEKCTTPKLAYGSIGLRIRGQRLETISRPKRKCRRDSKKLLLVKGMDQEEEDL